MELTDDKISPLCSSAPFRKTSPWRKELALQRQVALGVQGAAGSWQRLLHGEEEMERVSERAEPLCLVVFGGGEERVSNRCLCEQRPLPLERACFTGSGKAT